MDDMSEWLPLAAQPLNEYTVTPGVLGFIVFAVLGVAVWILLKSMSRHLGRISVKESDRGEAEGAGEPAGAATGSSPARS
ncbi:hypothetical protein [Streptomyces millisiae]|uniref:Uncharacterized protein n=1 Tax=Streptomyces millisiae TaxID=3075542 RepID=A0ABU2LVI6_9ACTN|nr:hypothetical protein [Streptomyces sp. DSM 44918]MDT0321611.1 hypothetical protein [Streptomyces sp. DSM 44918]